MFFSRTKAVKETKVEVKSPLQSQTAMDKCLVDNDKPVPKVDLMYEQKLHEAVSTVEGLLDISNCPNETEVYSGQIVSLKNKQRMLEHDKLHIELLNEYKEINLDFLKMGKPGPDDITMKGEKVKTVVPLFSIHHISLGTNKKWDHNVNDVVNNTTIEIGEAWVDIYIRDSNKRIESYGCNPNPSILRDPYAAFLLKYEAPSNRNHSCFQLKDKFKGIIPDTTKDCIKEAMEKRSNDKLDSVWLIKEAEWNLDNVTKDPLIVGLLGKRAYLIDHFDCTDIESWVKTEFSL
jgi:hypothetical protein